MVDRDIENVKSPLQNMEANVIKLSWNGRAPVTRSLVQHLIRACFLPGLTGVLVTHTAAKAVQSALGKSRAMQQKAEKDAKVPSWSRCIAKTIPSATR
jgi:hypothetical protein